VEFDFETTNISNIDHRHFNFDFIHTKTDFYNIILYALYSIMT